MFTFLLATYHFFFVCVCACGLIRLRIRVIIFFCLCLCAVYCGLVWLSPRAGNRVLLINYSFYFFFFSFSPFVQHNWNFSFFFSSRRQLHFRIPHLLFIMNSMDDVEIVQYVLRNKNNYYKVLMIEQTATSDQIKVAYKKMALKCHPDKNKHPQAAEAFKLVGSANATLSDETKRRIYDRHGEAGVQRHESGGARRQGNGAGAGVYRRRPAGQRDFFEEFFFGNARQRPGGQAGDGGNYYRADVDINPNMLLLIPIILFVIMAMLISNSFTNIDASNSMFSGSAGGYGGSRVSSTAFSFTPSPDEGIVVPRTTSLYGLRVQFYTTRRMSEMMDRHKDVYLSMEKKVLEGQRDYLGRRCEAEAFKFRSRGRKDDPPVCGEYQQFRRALG